MKKKVLFLVFACGLFIINSCGNDLKIKNDYGFSVTHLPVPKRLKTGETVEIRFELVRTGRYENTRYFVRFFQFDGKGSLTLDGQSLTPNDSYELKNESFRIYYTSECEEQQMFSLTFYDTFRNSVELNFSFSHDSKK